MVRRSLFQSQNHFQVISKREIANLLACVEALSATGKIKPEAMIEVGVTYSNAKRALDSMDDGDVLIVFSPSKKNEQPDPGGQEQPEASEEVKINPKGRPKPAK